MQIEYSYGFLGYFIKYFGIPVFIIMLLTSIFVSYLILAEKYYLENPFNAAFLLLLFMVMIPYCLKGIFYFYKGKEYFTKKYIFTDDLLSVHDRQGNIDIFPIEDIKKIVYLKALSTFEIHFDNKYPGPIVLMNNGQNQTKSFVDLKQYLLGLNTQIFRKIW